ncbi:hypothetical protein B0O80DRAFT_502988 [Mortierella sp. GBAus27b]|nr:hypothetical protein B0O80DRAFT_502988 [Mortierella sp. GBAus27b]
MGERFWARRVTNYRVDVSTAKTEGDLVDRSQFFANKRLRSRDDPNGSSSVSRKCRLSSEVPLKTNAGAITRSSTTARVPKRTASGAALETAEEERPTKVLFVEAELSSASGSDYVRSSPSSASSSLKFIDFKFIDHLVGPGTTSSRLRTSNRLTISDVDVSLTIMEKRRTLLEKQSGINDASDLLTLKFIFDEAWIKRNLSAEAARHLLSVSQWEVPDEERLLLLECSEFAASHTFLETKDFMLKKIDGEGRTITGEVLRGFTERANPWLQSNSYPTPPLSTLPQNKDTYTYATMENIVHGTLHDLEVSDHWGRDPLPVPVGWEERYEPDYYGAYLGFPFVLVEIKKPGASAWDCRIWIKHLQRRGRLDFCGVFRLIHLDSFFIPLKKSDFGTKAKEVILRSLALALRIKTEVPARGEAAEPTRYKRLDTGASGMAISRTSQSMALWYAGTATAHPSSTGTM